MNKLTILLYCVVTLDGCTQGLNHNGIDESHDYFQDASSCGESSQQFQTINVPSGVSQTTIQMPIGLDRNKYIDCMKQKNWDALPAKTFEIESVDAHCNKLSQENPESPKSHADCIEQNKLNIEVLPNQ